jgi:hypothetical protein
MAWPKFGKTEEEKKPEETQSKSDLDALVERFGATIESQLKPLRDDVTAMKSKWEDIEREATKPAPQLNDDGTPKQPTEAERTQNSTQAAMGLAIQANARQTENEVISEISAQWPEQVPEIRSYLANTPIARKALPDYSDYCRNIVDMVVGKAARKAGVRYDGNSKSFFLEDKSTSSLREDGPLSDPGLEWGQHKSDGTVKRWSVADQLRVLGIDPKEFNESVKRGLV